MLVTTPYNLGKEVAKFLADKREASPNINSPETQSGIFLATLIHPVKT